MKKYVSALTFVFAVMISAFVVYPVQAGKTPVSPIFSRDGDPVISGIYRWSSNPDGVLTQNRAVFRVLFNESVMNVDVRDVQIVADPGISARVAKVEAYSQEPFTTYFITLDRISVDKNIVGTLGGKLGINIPDGTDIIDYNLGIYHGLIYTNEYYIVK